MLAITANAQNPATGARVIHAENVKVSLVKNNLEVVWVKNSPAEANYWEVQGSRDGNTYSVIGLVMGADPKSNGSSYIFRQTNNKIKPGFKYYRVVHIENEEKAVPGNTTRLTK